MDGVFKDTSGNVTRPVASDGNGDPADYTDKNGNVWPVLVADTVAPFVFKWKTTPPSNGAYGQFDATSRIGVALNQADLVDAIDQFVTQYEAQHGRVNLPADDQPWYEALGGSPGFAIALVAAWLVWTDGKRGRRRGRK